MDLTERKKKILRAIIEDSCKKEDVEGERILYWKEWEGRNSGFC